MFGAGVGLGAGIGLSSVGSQVEGGGEGLVRRAGVGLVRGGRRLF